METDDDGADNWLPDVSSDSTLACVVWPALRQIASRTKRRVAVFTAEFGGYDRSSHALVSEGAVAKVPRASQPDVFYFTDRRGAESEIRENAGKGLADDQFHVIVVSCDEVVQSVPGLAERVSGAQLDSIAGAPANRVFKIMAPLVFRDVYDWTIYVDANAFLNAPIDRVVRYLDAHDLLMLKHPDRECAFEELRAIEQMRRCPSRVANFDRMRDRLARRCGLVANQGLVSGYFIAANNRSERALAFRRAWMREYTHCWRDQPAFMGAFVSTGARFVTTAATSGVGSQAGGATIRALDCDTCDPPLEDDEEKWPLATDFRFQDRNANMRRFVGRAAPHIWQQSCRRTRARVCTAPADVIVESATRVRIYR